MKKTLHNTICLLVVSISAFAQKEFWALRSGANFTSHYGTIIKTDENGANAAIIHSFDSIHGMKPYGRLFLASNGKLYGTASKGALAITEWETSGVLFEYDLVLNQFSVIKYFGSSEFIYRAPTSGVIEPVPGILYGTLSIGGIYSYNINTGVITMEGLTPNIGGSISNPMNGELIKASNGYVYGNTKYNSACPGPQPLLGSIVRLLPTNNSFQVIYPFNCTAGGDGRVPNGSMVEGAPGKLYGTTVAGGTQAGTGFLTTDGVLFEYDIATNTYTKKFSFDTNTTGFSPGPLSIGENNKLYGVLAGGGTNPINPDQNIDGTLYEYDIMTDTVTVLYYFVYSNLVESFGSQPIGGLLKASDGNFYGVNNRGVFKFDPITNAVTLTSNLSYNNSFTSDFGSELIEICRKPSYPYFDVNTYTICFDSAFTFDVQNTNATTYTWIKDGSVLIDQTTAVLNLESISIEDSGDYICEMENECGITTTMPLHLTADSCLGLDEVIGFKNSVKIIPNPVKDVLNFSFSHNESFEVQKLTIRNMLGQVVYSGFSEYLNIDVSFLSSGIYSADIKTDHGDWFGKL